MQRLGRGFGWLDAARFLGALNDRMNAGEKGRSGVDVGRGGPGPDAEGRVSGSTKAGRGRRIMVEVAVALVVGYGAMCGLLFFGQSKQVYFPDRVVSATPADAGLEFESLRIGTADGETLGAWYVPAGGASNVGRTVLYCHGNAGDIGDRVSHVVELHRAGFGVMVFDYRGYGESTGKPTEEGTYLDAGACWDYLVTKRGVPAGNIVLYGHSLGGVVAAVQAAGSRPGLLVVEGTFTSARDMAATMFPWLPSRALCRFRYDALDAVSRVSCPVVVAHSRDDEMIPYAMGRRLFDAAREPKRFMELRGGHNESGLGYAPEYLRLIVDFATNRTWRSEP